MASTPKTNTNETIAKFTNKFLDEENEKIKAREKMLRESQALNFENTKTEAKTLEEAQQRGRGSSSLTGLSSSAPGSTVSKKRLRTNSLSEALNSRHSDAAGKQFLETMQQHQGEDALIKNFSPMELDDDGMGDVLEAQELLQDLGPTTLNEIPSSEYNYHAAGGDFKTMLPTGHTTTFKSGGRRTKRRKTKRRRRSRKKRTRRIKKKGGVKGKRPDTPPSRTRRPNRRQPQVASSINRSAPSITRRLTYRRPRPRIHAITNPIGDSEITMRIRSLDQMRRRRQRRRARLGITRPRSLNDAIENDKQENVDDPPPQEPSFNKENKGGPGSPGGSGSGGSGSGGISAGGRRRRTKRRKKRRSRRTRKHRKKGTRRSRKKRRKSRRR